MSESVRNLSVEDSYILKERNSKASAIENSQVWPKGKKMVLVCIVRQTEYFIIFLLLVLQLSQNASKSSRLQENPVPNVPKHRAGIRWKGFLSACGAVTAVRFCVSPEQGTNSSLLLRPAQHHCRGNCRHTLPLLSAKAVLLLAEQNYPDKDKIVHALTAFWYRTCARVVLTSAHRCFTELLNQGRGFII